MAQISDSPYAVVEIEPLIPPQCCPTLSPDGQKVAFSNPSATETKIFVQNSDGSNLKQISSVIMTNGDGPFPDPVWSPDGQTLAFVDSDSAIYLVKADGTNLTRLEPQGFDPAWSPDGTALAFTSLDMDIYVMNSDGSNPRQLTASKDFNDQRPAWSPDGQSIAFVSLFNSHDANAEIFVINSDGSNQRRLTDNAANDWGPVFSPDGRHIIFTSDRSGRNAIYAMNSDGSNPQWLMDTEAKSRWRIDTTRVQFIEASRQNNQLPAEISQGLPFTLAQQFQVNPDEVKLVQIEQTTWLNDCMGIAARRPCATGDTPGYRITVEIQGQPYEFHAPLADPLDLRLAVSPTIDVYQPALIWEGDPALFGDAETGSCLSLKLTANDQGTLGECDGPLRAIELTGEQYARPRLWQDWLTRFAPFQVDTPHDRVVFYGMGSVVAAPAWQRALAAWAKLAALELRDGRSGAGWGAAMAWQQPLPNRQGYCQFLSVQAYGWAYASTALCDGGDPQNLGQGWIDSTQWEQFDNWFYNRSPLTTDRLSFFGVGSVEMNQAESEALEQWARNLYTELNSSQ